MGKRKQKLLDKGDHFFMLGWTGITIRSTNPRTWLIAIILVLLVVVFGLLV
jgi:hypothetical protein